MPVLLAFGDSNTHGSPPAQQHGISARYGRSERWPGVCAAALGPGWEVIEEGLGGRTTQFDDPILGAHRNGQPGLRIALDTHAPIDVLAIMLGTNDFKHRFEPSVPRLTAGLAGLLDIALDPDTQTIHGGYSILLICPPLPRETGLYAGEFYGAEAAAKDLPDALAGLAAARGVAFLDANQLIAVSNIDGIHLEPVAHARLGSAVAAALTQIC